LAGLIPALNNLVRWPANHRRVRHAITQFAFIFARSVEMTEEDIESTRQKYVDTLKPLFLPEDPVSNDIVNYFASLLRIVGMEDKGWDPYLESRAILEDLNAILQAELPKATFGDKNLTLWRMGLLMYSHIVEMDAPYEVIANLLRFRLGKGYSPNPFYMFLNADQKKRFRKSGIYPKQKIEIIKALSAESNLPVGDIFDQFYNGKLRNAISHSDYILTDEEFRCRNGTGGVRAFSISLRELNEIITRAKIFISTFFGLETAARECWGGQKHRAVPYDPVYKGLMEVLVRDDDLMCGFKVHWPNHSESVYRRADDGIEMINCMLDIEHATIQFMVGLYAREPGKFSPLVEKDGVPTYTRLEGTEVAPKWEI
jgi:hypothetical protein